MPHADYMPNLSDSAPVCPHCQQRMKLVRTIPSGGPAMPEVMAYWCSTCSYPETRKGEPHTTNAV
jgi:C4-type Zn-finger protein